MDPLNESLEQVEEGELKHFGYISWVCIAHDGISLVDMILLGVLRDDLLVCDVHVCVLEMF